MGLFQGALYAARVTMAMAGEDEEETTQGFPCSTVPMGW